MQDGISTRTRIAILIYSMTNAVLFGIGIVTVLNVPSLAAHAGIGIPVVVVLSLLLAGRTPGGSRPGCAPAIGGSGTMAVPKRVDPDLHLSFFIANGQQ